MATSVVVVSDLSGDLGARTYVITVGDKSYEVDLTDAEFSEYEAVVSRYVTAGRLRPAVSAAEAQNDLADSVSMVSVIRRPRDEVAAIKAWGEANGWAVPKRGRLAAALVQAYEEATSLPS